MNLKHSGVLKGALYVQGGARAGFAVESTKLDESLRTYPEGAWIRPIHWYSLSAR